MLLKKKKIFKKVLKIHFPLYRIGRGCWCEVLKEKKNVCGC